MRLLILGASGFIGSHLVRGAAMLGHEVIALCRAGLVDGFAGRCITWELGRRAILPAGEPVDCAVHLAHDFSGEAGARLTIDGTERCVRELREAGVRRQLYFSSYSAGPHASSIYGRTKYSLEQSLTASGDVTIIRPGLVVGGGGLYGRIEKIARLLPLIPLPDGGEGLVPVIGIDRLCRETIRLAGESTGTAAFNLFEPRLRTLREVVLESARQNGRSPVILPIPSKAAVGVLTLLEFLRIPLPVKTDNLKGFVANQQAGHTSGLSDE